MFRTSCLCALALLIGSFAGTRAVVPVEDKKAPSLPRQLQAKLAKPVSVPGFGPNTPLKEALGYLSEKFGLTILIDIEGFQLDLQIQEPQHQPVKLPALKEVPLRVILDLTIKQAQGVTVQRGNLLWVTTQPRARYFALNQRVDIKCDEMSLGKVLRQLSDQTGQNIVLDTRRQPKAAETPITLDLAEETLQKAVTLAADLAEMEVVEVGNTLYVTTPANAKQMRARMQHQHDCCPAPQAQDLGL